MSELTLRELAAACAPRIAAKVEAAVLAVVRDNLGDVLEQVLAERIPGETFRKYAPALPVAQRRERNNAIRAEYNGRNVAELAKKFKVSPRSVFRIISGRK